jgi:hypothetical protein
LLTATGCRDGVMEPAAASATVFRPSPVRTVSERMVHLGRALTRGGAGSSRRVRRRPPQLAAAPPALGAVARGRPLALRAGRAAAGSNGSSAAWRSRAPTADRRLLLHSVWSSPEVVAAKKELVCSEQRAPHRACVEADCGVTHLAPTLGHLIFRSTARQPRAIRRVNFPTVLDDVESAVSGRCRGEVSPAQAPATQDREPELGLG